MGDEPEQSGSDSPSRDSRKKRSPDAQSGARPHLVVGVGASAGGLQALKNLLAGLDPRAMATLVLAQHVSPSHQSMLAEVLAPKTELEVKYLDKAVTPRPNQVLIVPPNFDVMIEKGRVVPVPGVDAKERRARPNIDQLFHSLADEYGEQSVAIVLSGTGSDGTLGAAAIKSAGGVVLVQDPASAQFDAMPTAVIDTRQHDAVMSPEKMGEALVRLASAQGGDDEAEEPAQESLAEKQILMIKMVVRKRTGTNLNHYKQATVIRRLKRRMQLTGCVSYEQYLQKLSADSDEASRLAGDLSVRVTSFFRDPANFEALRAVMREKVRSLDPGQVLRIWVPGCASGEEAYTVGILLMEEFRQANVLPAFLMFVSDVDADAVTLARVGRFAASAIRSLPDEWVQRYFERDEGYVIADKKLRQYMIFATQNLVEDPPFSKLDLISCRNLLIYFEAPTQKYVLASFHYALKTDGHLFLGASESVEVQKSLFAATNPKARIYRRTDHPVVFQYQASRREAAEEMAGSESPRRPQPSREISGRRALLERTREIIADHYAPPAIVIDENDHIVHFVGDLSPFVTLPRGPSVWTSHQMVMAPLNVDMRAVVHRCRSDKETVRGGAHTMEVHGQLRRVTLAAHPDVNEKGGFLVFLAFEALPVPAEAGEEGAKESINLIRELENELSSTREHLQTMVEEVETSNEELQTVNEELQSSNEELQSTNEEMQTSNEELQSTNEELLTVNEELAHKTEELQSSRADLVNIKEALDVAIIAVDSKLAVTQFNHSVSMVLAAETISLGTPIGVLDWIVPASSFPAEVLSVIAKGERTVSTIETADKRALRMSIVPYSASGSKADGGAVLSFLDITSEVTSERQRREQEDLYRTVLEASRSGAFLTDPRGKIIECNPAALEITGQDHESLVGREISSLIAKGSHGEISSHLRSVVAGGDASSSFDAEVKRIGTDARWMSISLSAVTPAHGEELKLVWLMHDIDTLKRRQERLATEHSHSNFLNILSRHVLDMESVEQVRAAVLADLSVVLGDSHISFLVFSADKEFVTEMRIAPGGDIETGQKPTPVKFPRNIQRRLQNLELVRLARNPESKEASQSTENLLHIPVSNGESLVGMLYVEPILGHEWSEVELDFLRAIADILSVAERDAYSREQRAEAFMSLREQRERVETTLRSISDGVITTDVDGRIVSMNPPAMELCDCAGDEVIGRTLFSVYRVVRGDGQQHVASVVERCLHEMEPIQDSSLDLYLLRAGGDRIPINHSAAPIVNSEGELIGAVLVFRDVTDTRLLARELSYRASHDPLTDLPNRDEFDRRAALALKEVQAGHARHAVVAIDLDRFKKINDEAGHQAGDAYLRQVAKVGRATLRESDMLARVGGDEFAVLLGNCGPDRAMMIAESLVKAICDIRIEWEGHELVAGASAGVIMMSPSALSLSQILDDADAACYQAKRNGRGRVELSVADTQVAESDTGAVEVVRDCIARDHCIVATFGAEKISTKSLPDYRELLLRLDDASGNSLRPDIFIHAARRHQMLQTLDRLAIRHGIEKIASVLKKNDKTIFGLNLFAESLGDADLISFIANHARELKVPRQNICLELPESAVHADIERLSRVCQMARSQKLRVALDQFGSQLNSFAAIRSLALDYVKVNLRPQNYSFGRAAPLEGPVLEALVHICRRTGVSTIAVGVETESQRESLRKIGVDYLQGTLIEPVP